MIPPLLSGAQPDTAPSRAGTGAGSAGFPTCCIAHFQVGGEGAFARLAGWETRDTADLEICVMGGSVRVRPPFRPT